MRVASASDSKVILVGEPSVGKTSIIQQYNLQVFEQGAESTIGASFIAKMVETKEGTVQINIWDTAGQERYRSLIPLYSRNAIAGVIVVDVTNKVSFEKVENWLSILKSNCSPNCRVYIVANKCDLEITAPIAELEKWAKEHDFPFFRTSARDYASVSRVFERIGEDIAKSGTVKEDPPLPPPQLLTRKADEKKCC